MNLAIQMKMIDTFSTAYVKSAFLLLAELHARASRTRGRSPIAKEIYPSQKIW